MTATISRWGNSLGLRIPKAAIAEANLKEGDTVRVVPQDGQLVIVKVKTRSLDELVARITPENRHVESLPALVGNEVW